MLSRNQAVLLVERGHEGGTGGLAIPVARCLARAGGYEVHCLTSTSRHELRASSHAHVHVAEVDIHEHLLAAIRAVYDTTPIDVVVPVDEADIAAVAEVADQLREFTTPVPVPAPALIAASVDKWKTHRLLVAAGVPAPATIRPIGDRAADRVLLDGWGVGRFLVKPVAGWGGKGITVHDSSDAALDACDRARRQGDDCIVQEFVEGADRDVSFLAHDGAVVAWTAQEPVAAQTTEFRSALGLRFHRDARAGEIVRRLAAHTGWDGVAHIDMRVDERTGELRVIEINPRYWQTLLGSEAMGVNFPDLHCRVALGDSVCPPRPGDGVWYDTHAISADPGNVRGVRSGDAVMVVRAFGRELVADPRLEATLVWRGLRSRVSARLRSRADRRGDQSWRWQLSPAKQGDEATVRGARCTYPAAS